MVIISEEVHRLTDERELVLIQMEKEHKLALQKQREQEMLSQFDGIFRSGNIGELERISLIPRCVAAHISKEIIEEYALQEYRETKNALALLFLCCQYNVNGELEDCQPERIEQYLHANIRAKELKYEWLENLASLPNLSRHPQFNAALVQFVKSDEESQNEAKLNRDSLYYWMVENEILQSAARRYFILGGVIVGAITAVTAAGILLAKFGLLG